MPSIPPPNDDALSGDTPSGPAADTKRTDTRPFVPVNIAVLTISDSRTMDTDRSGDALAERIEAAGHRLAARQVVRDRMDAIITALRAWVADVGIDVVITTGGTGLTGRDVTPEAVRSIMDKEIEGFGELFRWLSYRTVGTSTIQSRALGALVGETFVFALPGSPNACRQAWDEILVHQLDIRHQPCNFIELLPRLGTRDRGA